MKPDFVIIDETSENRKPASIINNSVIVFVTIGVPFSSIPIMQKVTIFVDLEMETVVQAAKRLRKMVADNIENYGWVKGANFNPSQLYYEAYENVTDLVPLYCSAEAPAFRQAC